MLRVPLTFVRISYLVYGIYSFTVSRDNLLFDSIKARVPSTLS